jgi:hypothetical protein
MMLKYLTLALAVTAVSAVREMNFDYSGQSTKVGDWVPPAPPSKETSHIAHLNLNLGDKLPAPLGQVEDGLAQRTASEDSRFKQQAADLVAFQARTGRHLLQEGGEAAEAPAGGEAGGEAAAEDTAKEEAAKEDEATEEAAAAKDEGAEAAKEPPAGGEAAAAPAAPAATPAADAGGGGGGGGEDPNAQKVPHNWLGAGKYQAPKFTIATGQEECNTCKAMIKFDSDAGKPSSSEPQKGDKYGCSKLNPRFKSMCEGFSQYLSECPSNMHNICHQDIGGSEVLRSPCPAYLQCYYCLRINPLYCLFTEGVHDGVISMLP